MITELTSRQGVIFDLLREGVNAGRIPTIRELMARTGITSPNGVLCHIKALEKKGLIKRDPSKARGITLTHIDAIRAKKERVVQVAVSVVDGDCTLDDLKQAVAEYRS